MGAPRAHTMIRIWQLCGSPQRAHAYTELVTYIVHSRNGLQTRTYGSTWKVMRLQSDVSETCMHKRLKHVTGAKSDGPIELKDT
jgi:hypothetical protein